MHPLAGPTPPHSTPTSTTTHRGFPPSPLYTPSPPAPHFVRGYPPSSKLQFKLKACTNLHVTEHLCIHEGIAMSLLMKGTLVLWQSHGQITCVQCTYPADRVRSCRIP